MKFDGYYWTTPEYKDLHGEDPMNWGGKSNKDNLKNPMTKGSSNIGHGIDYDGWGFGGDD